MQEFAHMKSGLHIVINNQRGSVINVALLILILIFLVGIGLNKISTTDIKIASNMKTDATTFYEAEAALDAASELVEQNVACPLGFSDVTTGLPARWVNIEGAFIVTDRDFWSNTRGEAGDPLGFPDLATALIDPTYDPADNNIHAYFPPSYDGSEDMPHTNLSIGGNTRFARGSAIQMAAGYEGLGKGSAAGGANIIYDIYAMRYGEHGSEALHTVQWIHLLGMGGSCQY